MNGIGVLIVFALLGAVICAKSRSAGGAVLFGALALAMFVATPVGDGLPDALSNVLDAIDEAATPALTDEDGPGEPAAPSAGEGSG